jgi:GNAT superfamily N-acetyltransferase
MDENALITLEERPDLEDAFAGVIGDAWPEFMLHDAVANRYWADLSRAFPAFQFGLVERATGRAVAAGNCLPLAWAGDLAALPDEGWDWALAQGFRDLDAGRRPNLLCALSISISPPAQGKGLSAQLVSAMKALGRRQRLEALVAPVRPTLKHRYPLTPMERYVRWETETGLPFDPWLRVHLRLGAQIVNVCPFSMRIQGTVAEWEAWTGMRFPESGRYILPGGLVPLEVDAAAGQGIYIEPNVWVRHPLIR